MVTVVFFTVSTNHTGVTHSRYWYLDGWVNGCMDGWVDGWMGGWMDDDWMNEGVGRCVN